VREFELDTTRLWVTDFCEANQMFWLDAIKSKCCGADTHPNGFPFEAFGEGEALHTAFGCRQKQRVESVESSRFFESDANFSGWTPGHDIIAKPLWCPCGETTTPLEPANEFSGFHVFGEISLDPDFDASIEDNGDFAKVGVDEAPSIAHVFHPSVVVFAHRTSKTAVSCPGYISFPSLSFVAFAFASR
jgi:hypothetical protein